MFQKTKDLAWKLFPMSKGAQSQTSASDGAITVYRGTYNPTKCWQELSVKQKCEKVTPMPLDTPIYGDKVRFVCMSDTHDRTMRMSPDFIPKGDVFLHAGDFTMVGAPHQVEEFNSFLGELPHPHKVVIAGNHEMSFDPNTMSGDNYYGSKTYNCEEYLREKGLKHMSGVLTNCTYLEDAEVTVAGIKIYGSPWQPEFGNWAFNLPRGQACLDVWNYIPDDVEVLITHGPPVGHGDKVRHGARAGCVELLNTIQKRVKPKYHLFGHIHEAYGVTTDGQTTFINASTCNLKYLPVNPPVIFDLPLPSGCSKQDISVPIRHGPVPAINPPDNDSDDGIDFADDDETMDFMHEAGLAEENKSEDMDVNTDLPDNGALKECTTHGESVKTVGEDLKSKGGETSTTLTESGKDSTTDKTSLDPRSPESKEQTHTDANAS